MIELIHDDCMNVMAKYPDKHFDLSIVDPPYGIDRGETFGGTNWKIYKKKIWDKERPKAEYWKELFRVSKNQVVWGANYFTEFLPPSMGWIFWDKGQDLTMSDGELAFTSFDKALRRYVINRCHISEGGGLLHPTQKPIKLYTRIMRDYAKEGDKILDTHLGSASSAIAAHKMGFDFVGTEIDEDYFKDAVKRYNEQTLQLKLFKNSA